MCGTSDAAKVGAMTTTGTTSPTEEPRSDSSAPDLERPSLHPFRGVCSALARTTGTDVLLWRVLFIVLAFFNGLGLVLYLVGLITIPREGEPHSLAERLLRGPNRRLRRDEVFLVVLTIIAIGSMLNHGSNLVALAVITGVVLLFLRSRPVDGPGTPPLVRPATPDPMEPLPSSVTIRIGSTPRAPRRKSVLGSLTIGLAVLVTGFLVLLNTTTAAHIDVEAIIASALAVVGAGIVVSAFWGRSLLLFPVAVVLGIALAAASVAQPSLDAGIGDRTWKPTGSASYRLGIGEATLDLRNAIVPETGATTITARVDVGHLIVIIPTDARVSVHTFAKLGDLHVLELDTNGHSVSRDLIVGPEGPPQVIVDASVRLGQVEVRNG